MIHQQVVKFAFPVTLPNHLTSTCHNSATTQCIFRGNRQVFDIALEVAKLTKTTMLLKRVDFSD